MARGIDRRIPARVAISLALLVASSTAGSGGDRAAVGELGDETYAAWRDRILPDRTESAWREIPWKPTFRDGIVAAEAEGKPLLLWLMNGHPLGCT